MRFDDDASVDSDLSALREVSAEFEHVARGARTAAEGLIRRAITREAVVGVHTGDGDTVVVIECNGAPFRFPLPARPGFAALMEPRQREAAMVLFDICGVDDLAEQSRRLDCCFTVLASAIDLLQRSIGTSFEIKLKPNGRTAQKTITFRGETGTIAWWANKKGMAEATIRNRLNKGWTPEKIFGTRSTDLAGAGARGKAKSPWGVLIPGGVDRRRH